MSKNFYVMVGPPGCGKSTFVEKTHELDSASLHVISRDKIVDWVASEMGVTYTDVFLTHAKKIDENFNQLIKDEIALATRMGEDLFWDQTNMSKKSRKRPLSFAPLGYKRIAIVFPRSPYHQMEKRLSSRAGKNIPREVYERFLLSFDPVDIEEGFDEIRHVTIFGELVFKIGRGDPGGDDPRKKMEVA